MRLRNIPGAEEAVSSSPHVIHNPKEQKGNWNSVFSNEHPIHIEIGMGKGQFIMALAERNPQINYIGMERYSSVLYRGLQKMEEHPLPNLRFLREDAAEIEEMFDEGEIDRIYLNFSDPWPKDRHKNRRLTSQPFLSRYDHILAKDGVIEFKTDNTDLFRFSLEEIEESKWQLKAHTFDLHHDPVLNEGNIMTEYEERFSAKGNPIHKLIAYR